jgi:cytochrome b6-f complex iron-sulfur subunit
MAEKKKMSVAEILAAARKADNKGGGDAPAAAGASGESTPAESTPAESSSVESAAEEAAPAGAAEPVAEEAAVPAKAPAAKPLAAGERPNVKDILAMARAGKAGGGSAPAAAKPAAKAPGDKPAAKPAAAKTSPDKPAAKPGAAKPAAAAIKEKDTASILAAARAGAKPGPMTKAQAAALPAAAVSGAAKAAPKAPAKEKLAVPPMPAKPAYAKQSPGKAAPEGENRRSFLSYAFGSSLAIGMTAMAVTGGFWSLAFARFMFPNVLTEPPSRFKVGFKENFAPGQVETKFVSLYGVWIVNGEYNGKPEIYALKTVCTHLGCTPNWLEAEQKFKCPCHGSGFYKDGINFEGPAPRPLERYAVHIAEDGQLEVDKSRTFQEELGQWTDPDCFVTA